MPFDFLFGLLACGGIRNNSHHAHRLVITVSIDAPLSEGPMDGVVLRSPDAEFCGKDIGCECLCEIRLKLLAVLGNNVLQGDLHAPLGLERIVAEDLIVAKRTKCAIIDEVQIPHAQLSRFQSQLQALFARFQGFGCLPTVADIPDGAGDELALTGFEWAETDFDRKLSAIFAAAEEF